MWYLPGLDPACRQHRVWDSSVTGGTGVGDWSGTKYVHTGGAYGAARHNSLTRSCQTSSLRLAAQSTQSTSPPSPPAIPWVCEPTRALKHHPDIDCGGALQRRDMAVPSNGNTQTHKSLLLFFSAVGSACGATPPYLSPFVVASRD